MSSLVFVRDAQGRPLMPMSAAYARTLIHQGKAHVWPHPAFSVIQLTRVVATPILRPVLVGLALNKTTADLMLIIDQQRSAPSMIHVVIDFLISPSKKQRYGRREKRGRQRIRSTPADRFQHYQHRVRLLAAVLIVCQAVLPISHLMFLPSSRRSVLSAAIVRWIEQRLAARISQGETSIIMIHESPNRSTYLPQALLRLLIDGMAQVAHQFPHLVACFAPEGDKADRERTLCTVRHQRQIVTGVLQAHDPSPHLILRIPIHVDDSGVHWRGIEVPIHASLHLWPVTPVLILPLIRTRRAPPP